MSDEVDDARHQTFRASNVVKDVNGETAHCDLVTVALGVVLDPANPSGPLGLSGASSHD